MAQKNQRKRTAWIVLSLVLAVAVLIFGGLFASYGLSDRPEKEWGMLQVQKIPQQQADRFKQYLQRTNPPRTKEDMSGYLEEAGLKVLSESADKETGVINYGFDGENAYFDLLSTSTYTLQTASGLTNENITFIMCNRLAGKPRASEIAVSDIPCTARDNALTSNGEIPVTLDDKPSWLYPFHQRINGRQP